MLRYLILTYLFLFSYSFSQTCNDNCGNGTLQEYWDGQVDCVCSLDCAGYGDACCDFYDVCFENPSNLVFEDFVGTWEGNITNDQTWSYDYPITIQINNDGSYTVIDNPGDKLVSDSYPGTEEVYYNQSSNILTFRWVNFYHYSCGGPCYTGVYFQVMTYDNGDLLLFYNNGSGPAPQANTMNLSMLNWEPELTGDMNQDNIIDVTDIILLVNIILGLSPYNSLGDMNQDSIINVLDVIQIVNIILN